MHEWIDDVEHTPLLSFALGAKALDNNLSLNFAEYAKSRSLAHPPMVKMES